MGGGASSTTPMEFDREGRGQAEWRKSDLSDTRASSECRTRFSDSGAATCSSLVQKRLSQAPGLIRGWCPPARRARCHLEMTEEPLLAHSDALVRLWILHGAVAESKRPSRSRATQQPAVWPIAASMLHRRLDAAAVGPAEQRDLQHQHYQPWWHRPLALLLLRHARFSARNLPPSATAAASS